MARFMCLFVLNFIKFKWDGEIMKNKNGITLIALIITIIVLLILAGVALNAIMGESSIFSTSESSVEAYNKSQVKEKIELSINEKMLEKGGIVSVDEIIDKLIEKEITSEENSDKEIGFVITEDGYIVTIEDKGNGAYEVKVDNKENAPIMLSTSIEPKILTNKVTINIKGYLYGQGIKAITLPNGEKKEYNAGTNRIEETYEVTKNGKYKITLEGNDGQKVEKEVEINNIVEGEITIKPSTTDWTKDNIEVEVIYPEGTEQLAREISIDGGNTWEKYEEPVTIEGNTTVKARLQNEMGEIKTATLEITKIDKTGPIVTAKVSNVTITAGESNETSSYFEINQNGNAPITKTEYSISNTNELGEGTHTITCTVTKANGLTASASFIIEVKALEYAKITYTTPGTYTWTVPAGVTKIKVTVAGAGGGRTCYYKETWIVRDTKRICYKK